MAELARDSCSRDSCNAATDRKCLEGFAELGRCPHFVPARQAVSEGAPEDTPTPKQPETAALIDLPDGTDLNPDSAVAITCAAITRLVIIAGAPDSGKTTLLTSLYECFQEGPFSGYIFGGSRTLPGFERRCHLARIASGRAKADTERTKPGQGQRLLHLRVRLQDLSRAPQDLLLSDLSGETFRLAKDSTEECRNLTILRRADHFALLLDGEKLRRLDRRAGAVADGASLLRSCLDAEMLGRHSLVNILFTKWDLVETATDASAVKGFVQHVEATIRDRFESRVRSLRFFRVAARPGRGTVLPFAYGLEKVFPGWVEEGGALGLSRCEPTTEPDLPREFDRYLLRRLPQLFQQE